MAWGKRETRPRDALIKSKSAANDLNLMGDWCAVRRNHIFENQVCSGLNDREYRLDKAKKCGDDRRISFVPIDGGG